MAGRRFFYSRNFLYIIAILALAGSFYFVKEKESAVEPISAEKGGEAVSDKVLLEEEKIKEENFSGNFVNILGDSNLAKEARKYLEDFRKEFKLQADRDVPEMREKFGVDSPPATYTFDIKASQEESEKTQSIIITVYAYTGGAHGSTNYKVLTASKKDGQLLLLGDIIRNDSQEEFLALLKNKLKSWRPGDGGMAVFEEEVDALSFNSLVNWSLNKDNLTLYFSQYEIGPGALGAVSFPISLREISAMLE